MSFPSSARHRRRGASFAVILRTGDRHATSTSNCCRSEGKVEIPTLETLCLRSLESSLGKGLATFDLQDLPLGLAEKIYEFVSSKGSRMAHMELLRAFAPVLRRHIYSLDFSKAKAVGDSALLQLAIGSDSALMQLDLRGCRFVTDAGLLATLAKCPGLRDLTLSGCRGISDQTAFHLPHRCTSLTTLNLAGLQGITESGVTYLSFLPALEQLCLARCNLGDNAVVALATGPCRDTLKRLDLTGTAIKGACTASLRSMKQLEYLALSSTDSCVSAKSVAALARDLRLPVALPEAPKTRARSNRALLVGSKWSEQQLLCLPRKRGADNNAPGRSWQNGLYATGGYDLFGPSKAMRLLGEASRASLSSSSSSSCTSSSSSSSLADDLVEVGFQEGRIAQGGRQLVLNVVRGIVQLWPAVPDR